MYCHAYGTAAHKGTYVHCQNMPNHHTSICYEWVCEWVLHWKAKQKKGIALYGMADMYAPQEVDLGGGSPSWKSWMTQYEKVARPGKWKIVKWHLKI